MESVLSIIAIVISVISGGFAIYTFFWTAQRDRKQSTLDAYNTLQGEVFDKLNLLMPAEIQEIAKYPTSKEYKEIGGHIARLEHFCVGANTGIYDRATVYQLAHGYLDSEVILNRITPIIEKKHRAAEEDYYENIHKLLDWMQKKSRARQ